MTDKTIQERAKAPDPADKKYTYWHKGAFKKMFNNELFLADCKKYNESISQFKETKP